MYDFDLEGQIIKFSLIIAIIGRTLVISQQIIFMIVRQDF
jgi:hypothetical protein